MGDSLVIAASTASNLSADDATPVDTGHRDLSILRLDSTLASNPPLTFDVLGEHVADATWGGLPVNGRRRAELHIVSAKQNRLTVYEYDLGLPVQMARSESLAVKQGRQSFDLTGYRGILSFKFETADPETRAKVCLE